MTRAIPLPFAALVSLILFLALFIAMAEEETVRFFDHPENGKPGQRFTAATCPCLDHSAVGFPTPSTTFAAAVRSDSTSAAAAVRSDLATETLSFRRSSGTHQIVHGWPLAPMKSGALRRSASDRYLAHLKTRIVVWRNV